MYQIQKLNKDATDIFFQLIEQIDKDERSRQEGYLKIERESLMPLTLELLAEGIESPWGEGNMYGLMHYYTQNGDLMRIPDMTFFIVDSREAEDSTDFVGIWPLSFQQDDFGFYQESGFIENGKFLRYMRRLNQEHCAFANRWLINIREQGYLK